MPKMAANYITMRKEKEVIKIWKGPEMEGTNIGMMTMFVCSDVNIPTKTVISLLEYHKDIRRVYFGGGRRRFEGVDDWKGLYDYLFRNSINVAIETRYDELLDFIKHYDSLITTFICSAYDFPYTYNNLQFKTDDTKVVTVYNAVARTSLETLKENNLFTCDTMLLEED